MKPLLQILHIAKLSVYSLALSGVLVSCSVSFQNWRID